MRGNVIFDKTAGYSFDVDDYKVLTGNNYIMFTRKYSQWTIEYIVIQWDKTTMYHSNCVSHKDDFDITKIIKEEIAGFNFTPGYVF